MNCLHRASLCVILLAVPAHAQSFNIDVGDPRSGPAPTYAAKGQAGQWLSLVAEHNSTTYNLPDINGAITDVRVWQYGGTALTNAAIESIPGDDGALMNDCRVTYTSNLETCLFFYDLAPGKYEVLIYARMPDQDDVMSYTSTNEEAGYPHLIVGGPWPGQHQQGVTYSRHIADVTTGLLRVHSGIVPGNNPALGAAFNGIQIRPLSPADVNESGAVNIDDLVSVITSWGACPPQPQACPADVNHSGSVNIDDLVMVITNWG